MKKIDLVHYYHLPLDEYLRLIFEPSEEEVNDLTELPNVKEREEIYRHEDDKAVITQVRYSAIGFIPPQARKILKPHMLSWIEHSTYDKAGKFWSWDIEPHFFKDIFSCKGKMSLLDEGGTRTKRTTKGFMEVRFPVLGGIAEEFILKELVNNFDSELKMFNEMLARTGRAKS